MCHLRDISWHSFVRQKIKDQKPWKPQKCRTQSRLGVVPAVPTSQRGFESGCCIWILMEQKEEQEATGDGKWGALNPHNSPPPPNSSPAAHASSLHPDPLRKERWSFKEMEVPVCICTWFRRLKRFHTVFHIIHISKLLPLQCRRWA